MTTEERTNLNKYLHEKLFGACWHEVEKFHCSKCGEMFRPYWEIHPNYCQNIADAFKVVDKIKEYGFYLTAGVYHTTAIAEFAKDADVFSSTAETIEIAICQAAKAAIEGMEKEDAK